VTRVAITGIGAITPIGNGAQGLWRGVRRGQSAVRRVSRFDPSGFRSQLAAEVDDLQACDGLAPRQARRLDRYSQLAVIASADALADAALDLDEPDLRDQMGCYIGSALGGIAFAEQQHEAFVERGLGGVSPLLALAVFGGAAPSNAAMHLGLRGPSQSNSNSCASGLVAIGEAARLVRDGRSVAMLAGGVEAPLAPLTFGSFALVKAMSTANACPERASRPFDAARDGFVMAEGAAMLVLESLEHANARGSHVYAEVCGYGLTNDAHHMLEPLPDGSQAARTIQLALADAGVCPDEVDYVYAHASSTPLGDRAEARAIRAALGDHAADVLVSGTKGLHGHPLGASGAIETAIAALAMQAGWAPGTTNLEQPEADLGLNLVPAAGAARPLRTVLKNAFGFGGINAALVLRRDESIHQVG
jgi:3-oxoacyl-[acyl-carrier-protein] synthase II